jgi:hypothetical protein
VSFKTATTGTPPRVWIAGLLTALALAALAYRAWGLVRVALLPADARSVEQIGGKTDGGDRGAVFESYAATVGGRSLFWRPSAPGQGVATRIIEEEAPEETAGGGYAGPAIVAVVLDTVWFEDGERIKVGEKGGNGIEVVSVDPPWEATLRHRGAEHVVAFFARDRLIFTQDRGARKPSAPTTDESTPGDDAGPGSKPAEDHALSPTEKTDEKGESQR